MTHGKGWGAGRTPAVLVVLVGLAGGCRSQEIDPYYLRKEDGVPAEVACEPWDGVSGDGWTLPTWEWLDGTELRVWLAPEWTAGGQPPAMLAVAPDVSDAPAVTSVQLDLVTGEVQYCMYEFLIARVEGSLDLPELGLSVPNISGFMQTRQPNDIRETEWRLELYGNLEGEGVEDWLPGGVESAEQTERTWRVGLVTQYGTNAERPGSEVVGPLAASVVGYSKFKDPAGVSDPATGSWHIATY